MSLPPSCIKTLIIDNYDSYTFNLLQLIPCQVVVIRNDQFTWQEFCTEILPHFDNIVISPGPGRPERETDFGICGPLLQAQLDPQQSQYHRPIFGICLGHQGIGHLLGGKVTYAPRIMHGRMSEVHCVQQEKWTHGSLFQHCSLPFWAVRYHSLVVDSSSLPPCLALTAYCEENDADVEALKTATFLSDENDNHTADSKDHHYHYLQHVTSTSPSTKEQQPQSLTVMGFQHKTLPLWGVQFHPESVSTEFGQDMMNNFISETCRWMEKVQRPFNTSLLDASVQAHSVTTPKWNHQPYYKPSHQENTKSPSFTLHVKKCFPSWVDSEYLVEELMNGSQRIEGLHVKAISWLDSSRKSSPYSQMSILSVDPAIVLRYSILHRQINIQDRQEQSSVTYLEQQDTFFDYISREVERIGNVPVQYMKERLQQSDDLDSAPSSMTFHGGYIGYFGYEMKRESLPGYVTPLEQQCHCVHHGNKQHQEHPSIGHCCECMEEPDAAFHFVDRFWMFDHTQRQIYVCGLLKRRDDDKDSDGDDYYVSDSVNYQDSIGFNTVNDLTVWMQSAESVVLHTVENIRRRQLAEEFISLTPNSSTCTTPIPKSMLLQQDAPLGSDLFTANVQHDAYLTAIEKCINQIKEGESYEICLTTRFRLSLEDDVFIDELQDNDDNNTADSKIFLLWKLYTQHLRKNNPAPFSALIQFPGSRHHHHHQQLPAFALLSSSPERFLKVEKGTAEMKPIKGTMARALQCVCDPRESCDFGMACEQRKMKEDQSRKQRLWEDVKERAENLMIVDLIRNDLAQVCDPSSVQVPKLMHVETYEKVHHLVSTVRGNLKPQVNAVDALKKCFPPGSMTGAPKLRSVQLLDQLEHHKRRGVYSGCLGYLSLNGSADFNVVIRTAIATSKSLSQVELSVGGGGAITFLSDPEQEWKETLLKTKSVAPSVKEFLEQRR